MRNPRDFLKPLAIGAPDPLTEIPFKPSRMIHFLDFSNEKMVAKAPDIATKTDILLGNLEDAVPVDRKEAAREGLIRVGRDMDLGPTALWTRVNALESPWVLDDLTRIVDEIGARIEVIMVPKVEGPWDIHYVDRLLAQLEARAGLERPIRTRPSRAASLRSTGTASSRLPSRTSARWATSGSLVAIFSLLGSKKWIIRDGGNGISRSGSGAPTASGWKKSRGLRMRERY